MYPYPMRRALHSHYNYILNNNQCYVSRTIKTLFIAEAYNPWLLVLVNTIFLVFPGIAFLEKMVLFVCLDFMYLSLTHPQAILQMPKYS